MQKASQFILLAISALLLAAIVSGCGSAGTITPTPLEPPPASTLFPTLRADGGAVGAMRSTTRRAAKASRTLRRQLEAKAIQSGSVNVYFFSEPAAGKDWNASKDPLDIANATVTANGLRAAYSAYADDGYMQIYLAAVPAEGKTMAAGTQLTTDSVNHWSPAIAPSGSMVAYIVSGGETKDRLCVVATTAGSVPSCLNIAGFAPQNYAHPAWAPDGTIVVEAWDCDSDCSETEVVDNIFSVSPDGSGLTQITDNAGDGSYDEAATVSSDGKYMAVSRYNSATDDYQIYVYNLSTGARSEALTSGGYAFDPLFVGPDKIVYVWENNEVNDYARLYVMDSTGANNTAISPDIADSYFDDDFYGY